MRPNIRIVLIAEDRYSIGRIFIIGGLVLMLIIFLFFDFRHILVGDISTYTISDWGSSIFAYLAGIFFIIIGIIYQKHVVWPEFVEELYPDGLIRYQLTKNDQASTDSYIPVELIVRISKYRKIYSRRKNRWYIRFDFDFLYENKVYTAIAYGWLKEPNDIKEFEKYVMEIKKHIEKNMKDKDIKITFSMTGYSVYSWKKLDYAKKLKEEREKLISGENEEEK